ncbi:hypothetical protein BH11MYX3_BH11MYX3_08330 [soil metagenome]
MRTAVTAATLVVTALCAATASAQPAMTAPFEPGRKAVPEVKSESTATLLAIGATVGGIVLTASGAERQNGNVMLGGIALSLIGPSVGHFYAGETAHGVKMSLLRGGAALVLGVGVLESAMIADCAQGIDGSSEGGCSTGSSRTNGERMIWIGGATLVVATVYDLWDAHNAAHRTNEKAARAWTIAPSIMAGASGTTLPALAVAGSW